MKSMSSLERKMRLERLAQIKMLNEERLRMPSGWVGLIGLVGAICLSFGYAVYGRKHPHHVETLLACLGLVAVITYVLWDLKIANKRGNATLSVSEELDWLLTVYEPLDKEAYFRMQSSVRECKELTDEALRAWVGAEQRAVNEHLSPQKNWSFADRTL